MEYLSIRGKEIEKLKTQLKTLQDNKLKIDNSYITELHKSHRINQRIEQLENEYVMAQTLAHDKECIWVEINEAITKIWRSIEIIFEHEDLIHRSKDLMEEVRNNLR